MSRIPACLFALLRELDEPSTFPRWMVIDLAERFMLGERAALRLLAAVKPGVAIPDDVLPPEQRLDVDAIVARNRELVAAWDALPVSDSLPVDDEHAA